MPGYEEVRDSLDPQIAADWKAADREVASLSETYRALQADERYTESHKAQAAWEAYEQTKERVVEARKRVQKKLDAEAALEEHRSLPKPEGQSLHLTRADTLLAAQQESNRIRRKLERLSEKRVGGGRTNLSQHLESEYQKGLREGGLEGLCRCKATLMVADEYGISHEFLDDLREPYHREALERARYLESARGLIGKGVPEPPYPRPSRRVRQGEDANPFRKSAAS